MKILAYLPLVTLAGSLSAASFSDDFNRESDVAATATGSEIGTGWTIGANTWGIDETSTDGRAYTRVPNNSVPGISNAVMWNTSVAMASTAALSSTVSVDVLGDSAANFFGMAFNVQNSGDFYQFRLKFGTRSYQIIEFTDNANTQTIVNQGNGVAVADAFDAAKNYTLELVSNVGGVVGDYSYTITEAGSTRVLNNTQTTFSDTTYTGGYAGFTHANNGADYYYDNFSISTVPEPSAFALISGSFALISIAMRRRRHNQIR